MHSSTASIFSPTPRRSFKAFRSFNAPARQLVVGRRERLTPDMAEWFSGDGLPQRLARALCHHRALPIKELFESFEFFERVRRRMRATCLADVCCGHGLTGVLFAVFESRVASVVLIDKRRPKSFDAVMAAITEVAPWAVAKVRFSEEPLSTGCRELPQGTSVIAVHACGARTDRVLEVAMRVEGNVAVMPCCYHRTADRAPRSIRKALSADLATDIDRTYRLEAAGFRVDWSAVPSAITPCHRIVVGVR